MKRILSILLFCALVLTGCGVAPTNIVNDVNPAEPIRIVAVIESQVPVTATPQVTAASPPRRALTPAGSCTGA